MKQLTLLKQAMDSFPEPMAALRDAILSFAGSTDMDLLGSGDADFSLIDEAWPKCAGPDEARRPTLARCVQALGRWLEAAPDRNAAHLGPVWAIHAYLLGTLALGGEGGMRRRAPVHPAEGLARVGFDVPAGMRLTVVAGGIQLRDRHVDFCVTEIDPETADLRSAQWVQIGQPGQPNHWGYELDRNLAVGKLSAIRVLSRYRETGLALTAMYLLDLPCGHVEVQITARRQAGFDLSKYESLVGTIRCLA